MYVVRHYGNKHLGPLRFQLISAAARTAIARLRNRKPERKGVVQPEQRNTAVATGIDIHAASQWLEEITSQQTSF